MSNSILIQVFSTCLAFITTVNAIPPRQLYEREVTQQETKSSTKAKTTTTKATTKATTTTLKKSTVIKVASPTSVESRSSSSKSTTKAKSSSFITAISNTSSPTYSPSATPTSANIASAIAPATKSSLSGGAVAGVVIAIIAAIAIAGVVAWLFLRRKQKGTKSGGENADTDSTHKFTHNSSNKYCSDPMQQHSNDSDIAEHYTHNSAINNVPVSHSGFMPEKIASSEFQPYQPQLSKSGYNFSHSSVMVSPSVVASNDSLAVPAAVMLEPSNNVQQHQPSSIYKVVATYTPTLNDEIEIHPGDEVAVLKSYDDKWCLGTNLNTNRTGVFPEHCINMGGNAVPGKSASPVPGNELTNIKRTSSILVNDNH